MININNKTVLEECPRLCFEYETTIKNLSATLYEIYTVDYESKIATVVSHFNQNGISTIITTIYKDSKATHHYHGWGEDDVIEMNKDDYMAMFKIGGVLRPVNFDNIEKFNLNDKLEHSVDSESMMGIQVSDATSNVKMLIHAMA